MPSAKKDRITVSLHLDKRLYTLLKRGSAIERTPMSRIIDNLISTHLEKYEYESLEDWEKEENDRDIEKAIEAHEREQNVIHPDDLPIDERVGNIRRNLEKLNALKPNESLPIEKLEIWKAELMSKLTKEEKRIFDKQKIQRLEKIKVWKEVCNKNPLP